MAIFLSFLVFSWGATQYISKWPIKYCKLLFTIVFVSIVIFSKDVNVEKQDKLQDILAYAIRLRKSLCTDGYKHGTASLIMFRNVVILHVQPDHSQHDIVHNSKQFMLIIWHIDMQFGNEQENNYKNGILHDFDQYRNAGNIKFIHYDNNNLTD